jgi:hypothetical protein
MFMLHLRQAFDLVLARLCLLVGRVGNLSAAGPWWSTLFFYLIIVVVPWWSTLFFYLIIKYI